MQKKKIKKNHKSYMHGSFFRRYNLPLCHHSLNVYLFFFYCFSQFEDIHIIKEKIFHKNRNTQIQVYTIQHLELETGVKLVRHVVSFIGKELAEDRKSCHQVPVASIAVINLLVLEICKFVFKR